MSNRRDGFNRSLRGVALASQDVTTSVANGETIDMQGANSTTIVFSLGAFTYTDTNKVGLGIKTKDAGGSFATVDDAGDIVSADDTIASGIFTTVITEIAAAGATYSVCFNGGLTGRKRYITPFLTIGGTVDAIIGATFEQDTTLKAPTNT